MTLRVRREQQFLGHAQLLGALTYGTTHLIQGDGCLTVVTCPRARLGSSPGASAACIAGSWSSGS